MLPLVVAGVALFYVAVLMKDVEMPDVLPVNNVQVKGELNFLKRKDIETAVKNNISGGYFTLDLNNIREMLMQEPWVQNVSLRRQWPAGLNIVIDEKIPVAYWNNKGFISKSGEVFEPEFVDNKLNIPKLHGPEGHHDNVWKFMNVIYKEMVFLEYQVVRLELDDRRAWQLVINTVDIGDDSTSGQVYIDVKLGRFDAEKRLQRFVRVLPALTVASGRGKDRLLADDIKSIDMRYPNGFAVQMRQKFNDSKNVLSAQQYLFAQKGEA